MPVAPSTTLTHAQLEMYAQAAGVRDTDTAAAIAQAESGGNTHAHNVIPPDDSYGPWQINMAGSLGPARRKQLGITTNDQLYDPTVNARAMALISKGGTDWSPWSTYKSGSYRSHLTGSSTSGTGSSTSAQDVLSNPLSGTVNAAEDAVKLAVDAANWVVNPRSWVRVAYVVGGVAVVLVGLNLLLQNAILGRVSGALGGDKNASASASASHIGKQLLGGGGKKAAAKAAAPAAKKAAAPAAKKAAAPAAKKAAAAPQGGTS